MSDHPDPDHPIDQRVVLELQSPLSREAAGMAPGRDSVIRERRGHGYEPEQMLDVAIRLPNGDVLRTPAIGVVISTAAGAPADAAPKMIVVNRVEATLEKAESALLDAAERFNLDRNVVQAFLRTARSTPNPAPSGIVASYFNAPDIADVRLVVGARAMADRDRVSISYTLTWD